MLAFDRDGTIIGAIGDYEGNHPMYIKRPGDQRIIQPVANWINQNNAVVISNQAGIKNGYVSLDSVVEQFVWLMGKIPGIKASFFCPDDGQSCWMIWNGDAIEISTKPCYAHLAGTYRKPQSGMFEIAKDQFGEISGYVGDLSGIPDYGKGQDSDRQAALKAGIPYFDIRDFLKL